MTMKGGNVLDSVKMLACMLGGCNIGLQWSINGVLIETSPLVVGSRAEGGVASKRGDETRLMTKKGGTVLDSVKILACMLGGCNIGLQWSPLQKWIAAVCALHIYCVQLNTHAECTCTKCAQIAHVHTKYVLLAFVLYVCIL